MKLFYSVLFCLATLITYSQHQILGEVRHSETDEVLAFVNIYIPELEKGITSDENGKYTIENLPIGTYTMVFSYIGFETYSTDINLPTENPLNVSLRPSAIEMKEVILSTPFHKLQSDNVMKVEQQKLSDLRSKGLITLSNSISEIVGVETVSTGTSISKPVIRGLSSNRVLVYTQGVRLENQQFGDEHGLGVNDAGIESIEVIKGPSSLLYGSDALGGVLYLNPERFADPNTSSGDVNFNYFTNTQGYATNAGYKSSPNAFKLIFRGSLAEHSDYNTQDFRVTNSRFKEQDFKAAIGYQKSLFKTELRYNLNASQLGIPEEIGVQNTNTTPLLPFQEINNHIFSSKTNLFFTNSSLEANFGFIYNDRKEFEEHHEHEDEEEEEEHEEHEEEEGILEPALHMKLRTFNYDIKYNLPHFGKFETIVGVQGMYQENINFGEEELIPDATTNDIGVLATSHIHFETIDVQVGLRFDSRSIHVNGGVSKDFNSFNAAAGLKANLGNKGIARLNLASGFRAPNLAELTSDGTHEGTNRYEIGNPDLNNEQNVQVDLSFEYQNEHIEVFANAFYNHVDNFIFLLPNGDIIDDTPVYLYTQDKANLFGGEFGFHFHPHPLDWLHVETSFETVTGKQDSNTFLPLIPANKVKNTLRVEFEEPWIKRGFAFITLNTVLKQFNVSQFESETDGYNLLSAGFGGTFDLFKNSLTLNISATNLTNRDYINHLSRLKADGISNIGRNFSLGIQYEL